MNYSADSQQPPQRRHPRLISSRPAATAGISESAGSAFSRRLTPRRQFRRSSDEAVARSNPNTRYAYAKSFDMPVLPRGLSSQTPQSPSGQSFKDFSPATWASSRDSAISAAAAASPPILRLSLAWALALRFSRFRNFRRRHFGMSSTKVCRRTEISISMASNCTSDSDIRSPYGDDDGQTMNNLRSSTCHATDRLAPPVGLRHAEGRGPLPGPASLQPIRQRSGSSRSMSLREPIEARASVLSRHGPVAAGRHGMSDRFEYPLVYRLQHPRAPAVSRLRSST